MELGNLMFNTNKNQKYYCEDYIIALLKEVRNELNVIMWNKYKNEYDNPFDNTGNTFKNSMFEVQAYSWNDDIEQQYNFKYKDIEISWYKYLGRDTTINKKISEKEAVEMYNNCIKSLKDSRNFGGAK